MQTYRSSINVTCSADNQVSDIAPLALLAKLEDLDIENNEISDVSPLISLASLTELWLNNNPVKTGFLGFGENVHIQTLRSRGVNVRT